MHVYQLHFNNSAHIKTTKETEVERNDGTYSAPKEVWKTPHCLDVYW